VAAALQPAVLVPMSGLQNWLTTPTGCGWLDELLVPISEFARFGIGLSPDAIPGLADASQLEEELAQVVAKTNEWLQTSRRRRSQLERAVDVWRQLVDDEGAIAAFLAPVIADRRDLAAQVEKDLSLWRDPLNASAKIDVIDRSLGHGHRRKIEGGVRQYLMR